MFRAWGRTWVGLLVWLLMQAGLLVGAVPTPAAHAHTLATACAMTPDCMTPAHALHMARMHHARNNPAPPGQTPCCHVHAGLSDMPAPPVPERLSGLSAEGTRAFIATRQAPAPGGDWLPPLRPPKIRNI
ncbi:hypothetical protein CFR75_11945 [Komagataeibacter xylinus]|uniref:Uncharacterized protein n=1 Tax=Komagataeibacter xylinus TaxID=28448 RepID=A0A318PJP9_KOMXY|nr:hypothetical protein [Komagataeibacter xylinus]AZV38613.1 hypothetical protein CXP35_07080 [Komagataeibacter xylinus]PYD56265.1 hypothetical protein CFR75_11945 [Komagataeibacter xylinus]GBQ69718.1 hypothetical protein AA15237_0691 [Komagataeibacter xylinus NBRC 15237]